MNDEQKFQGKGALFALKVHAVWEKVESVVLFPFRWVSEQVGQTDIFRQEEARLAPKQEGVLLPLKRVK